MFRIGSTTNEVKMDIRCLNCQTIISDVSAPPDKCANCGHDFSYGGWIRIIGPDEANALTLGLSDSESENTSGQGRHASVPNEIKNWNWGAFLFTWIWGIGNNTFIAFLCFIPIINIAVVFVLGAKGN